MPYPLVSIIIPVYNSSKYLRETLDSIKNQNYKNWECIIVDDESTDNSVEIINIFLIEDKRFKLFERPSYMIKGGNSCRNYGFENSKGEFINWFDSDDVMLENFISDKMNVFNKETEIVISSGYFVNEFLENKKVMKLFQTDNLYESYFLWKLRIITNSVLFRRTFLPKNELFLPFLKKGQEFDLFTRIFIGLKPFQYIILERQLFLYRSSRNSISNNNKDYVYENKESEVYTTLNNLSLAISIKNKVVVSSAFRLLINLFQKAIIHSHEKNIYDIFNGLKINIGRSNNFLILILKLIIIISKYLDISFLKWDKIIKRYPINIID